VWRRRRSGVVRRGGDEEMKVRFFGEFFLLIPSPSNVCARIWPIAGG